MQWSGTRLSFNGLGIAKRYCSFDLIGDRFSQCGGRESSWPRNIQLGVRKS